MERKTVYILKNIVVVIITMLAFGVGSKLIAAPGGMPKFMTDAYEKSIFVETGTKTIAIVTLCSIISIFLLISFYMLKKGLHHNKIIGGLLYGISFGVIWFFGFTEMIVINNAGNVSGHLRSSVRDLLCLTVFGLFAGLLLSKNSQLKIKRDHNSLLAIPLVAVSFAIFHTAQFYYTFNEVSSYQRIDGFLDIVWLLCFGGWIGFVYYLFKPGIGYKNPYLKTFFFSFFVFGTDWLLYNFFYLAFIKMPVLDLILRSVSDCAGVFAGLACLELITSIRKKDRLI